MIRNLKKRKKHSMKVHIANSSYIVNSICVQRDLILADDSEAEEEQPKTAPKPAEVESEQGAGTNRFSYWVTNSGKTSICHVDAFQWENHGRDFQVFLQQTLLPPERSTNTLLEILKLKSACTQL